MTILAYAFALIVVIFVSSLVAVCWLEVNPDRSNPPSPGPTVGVENNETLGSQEAGERDPNDQKAKHTVASLDQSHAPAPQRPNKNARDNHGNDPPTSGWTKADVILAGVFSFCLVVVGFLQWWSMKEQAKYMNIGLGLTRTAADAATKSATAAENATKQTDMVIKQMRIEQRPWLSPQPPILAEPFADLKKPQVSLVLRNNGNTPARIIRKRIGNSTELSTVPMNAVIKLFEQMPLVATEQIVIFPHADLFLDLGTSFDPLLIDMTKEIAEKDRTLCLFATLIYADIWGDTHPLEFSFRWVPDAVPPRFYLQSDYIRAE
jgi:hypothetical protein